MAAFVACLLIAGLPSAARADTTRDRAAARSAADAGADAFEAGKYDQALELFVRAEALFHAPPHLLFIARSQRELGKLVEARETYLKLVSEKLPSGAPNAFKTAQATAETELNAVEQRLAYVTLNLRGSDGSGVTVVMDGAELPSAMIGIPIPVDPGTHVFSARSADASSRDVRVELREAARQTIELELSERSPKTQAGANDGDRASSPSGKPSSPAPSPAPERGSSQRTWGFITVGAGAVVAGVGTGFMVSSLSSRSQGDDVFACDNRPDGCTDGERDQVDAFDAEADRKQNIAIAGFVVGGAAIVSGLVLVLTADSPDETQARRSPALHLVAGPTWLGAAGTF